MDVSDLSDKQKQSLTHFRAELGPKIPSEHDDRFLIKWLVARNFQVSKSKAMYLKSMEWRKRMGADNVLNWQAPEVLRKYYAGGQMGYDKQGCPIFIDLVSYMDIKGLLHSAKKSDILKYEVQQLEKCLHVLKQSSKKLGRPIDQFTVVMDMQKLGMKQFRKQFIKMYNEIMQMTEDNYPEYLKQCFIINAPRIFPMVYNLVKPFLSEDTRRKVHVLGGNWKSKVLEHIDAGELPVQWGGTRTDPDGNPYCQSQICLGGDVPTSYYLREQENDVTMSTIHISRKQHHQIGIDVSNIGSSIRYQFRTEDYDIGFGVFVTDNPKDKLSDMTEVLPIEKTNSHLVLQDGAIECNQTGTYVMVFDNRDSWMNGKTLSYNIELMQPEDQGTDVDGDMQNIRL